MNLDDLHTEIERRKGARNKTATDLKHRRTTLEAAVLLGKDIDEAQALIQAVAQRTQQEIEYRIGELVTLAMEAVFPDPYALRLRFEVRRGRTEADLLFVDKNGEELDPMDATGGGAVDVAAFALRVALWSLQRPRSRATIVMDEPFRFLSSDLQPRAGVMLREVSERLGLQFILVTHEEEILEAADRVFRVRQRDGKSEVEVE